MLSYWNQTLKNISKDERKDKFVFLVNNYRFEVPLSYALGISPYITEEYLKNPTFRELEITGITKIEEEFSNFIGGKEIKKETYLKIGKILNNKEMLKIWKESNELTKDIVIENINYYIKEIINNNEKRDIENIQEEIQYIGEHFEEMKDLIKQLPEEELAFLLQNKWITVPSEDTLWEIIREKTIELKRKIYQGEGNQKEIKRISKMRRILLGNVKVKFLNMNNFIEYINQIEAEDFINAYMDKLSITQNHFTIEDQESINIWNQIKEIVLNILNSHDNINHLQMERKEKLKEHKEGNNFNGIIKYLEDKYGNIIDQGIATIHTCSNAFGNPKDVIDYENNNQWLSDYSKPGQWWEINFKTKKVKINGYSIKTVSSWASHLKNWVIEGKNEGEDWKEIDRQDNFDLNGTSHEHYYSIPKMTQPYQYIRIKSIGRDHYGHLNNTDYYRLSLSKFEIFGEIDDL